MNLDIVKLTIVNICFKKYFEQKYKNCQIQGQQKPVIYSKNRIKFHIKQIWIGNNIQTNFNININKVCPKTFMYLQSTVNDRAFFGSGNVNLKVAINTCAIRRLVGYFNLQFIHKSNDLINNLCIVKVYVQRSWPVMITVRRKKCSKVTRILLDNKRQSNKIVK